MTHRITRRLILGAFTLVAVWWLVPRPSVTGKTTSDSFPTSAALVQPTLAQVKEAKYFGTATCSSMACHNFNGKAGSFRSEYSTWSAQDRHANAFLVLYNDRSQRIYKNLPNLTALDGRPAKSATDAALCLKCHATGNGDRAHNGERFTVVDGVGCESCHGPSEHYLATHFKDAFLSLNAAQKHERYGLYPTKDLVFRTQLCASCHVGNGSKEVNHDLIAAGHPRLSFDLGAYLGIYHKHWKVSDERKRHPDFQARAWLIGQIGSARAAVELLRSRAEGSLAETSHVPWPEFAEYECFACHQDLEVKTAAEIEAKYGKQLRPGSFPWQTWYTSSLRRYAEFEKLNLESLNKLSTLMQDPSPDAMKVAEQARVVLKDLDGMLAKVNGMPVLTTGQLRAYFSGFLDSGIKDADSMSWDEATQLYLSLAALNHGMRDLGDPNLNRMGLPKALMELKKDKLQAAFPPGYDSPRDFNPLAKPTLKNLLEGVRKQFGN